MITSTSIRALLVFFLAQTLISESIAQVNPSVAVKPDLMLQIDLNRASLVDTIIDRWKIELTPAQTLMLRNRLSLLRADLLFSANVSSTLDGVLEAVTTQASPSRAVREIGSLSEKSKAAGEPARDLVYTPVAPCRILDTRRALAAGLPSPLSGGTLYPFKFTTTTSFLDFGGSASNCNIPPASDVKAVVLGVSLLQEQGLPNFSAYAGISDVNDLSAVLQNAILNFNIGDAAGSTAILRAGSSGEFLYLAMPTSVKANYTVEITGYFTSPMRTGDGLRVTNTNSISPNVVNGAAVNFVRDGVRGATIAGGGVADQGDPDYGGDAPNRVTDHYGFIGGGFSNRVGNDNALPGDAAFATIVGGRTNTAGGQFSFIGGGVDNSATGYVSTIAGGERNQARDSYSFVGGGEFNLASGLRSIVGGGTINVATGSASGVLGGEGNTAAGPYSTVVGGTGNNASGQSSMVLGGEDNTAAGPTSLAAGVKANAPLAGCFVWGDSLKSVVDCNGPDQFVARARGGFRFYTGGTTGAYTGATLPAGEGAWTTLSDIGAKTDIASASPKKVLESLLKLPILTWRYKSQPGPVRHMGPSAQAFMQAFGLGASPLGISTVDADGVALAAIQGLNEKLVTSLRLKDKALASQSSRIEKLEKALAEMQLRMSKNKR
jgi:hypothetical protein